ncbi:PH domain-containing protein [Pseudomonas sp. IT-P44]|uniref:toxin VasX n=1 Tax=Pseudomonas sp. IT-P44 TaxID=3026451 RepID=UPI0039DF6123
MSQTGKNPNAVDLPRSDAKCSTGGCSQMKQKLQLIPLRYGLVERLDPSSELSLPYKTASRPMGIRLLRDGWLYVIDNTTGYLHEYEVKNGVVTKCIWKGKEATQNKRTGSAGENALIFTRGSSLHIAYAEVQWTAAKCSQMLKSSKERDLFMQKVNLAKGDVEKGGPNLLTDKQAEKWIAEVAEKPATQAPPTGAHPEESKDYIWEDQKNLFKATQLGTIKKSLLPAYEKDHFFLVFKDSIGVMRDLAEQQDKVVGWIDEWVLKEKNDLKYSIGNYIETLMVVSEKSARQAGTSDALFEKTTPEQRQKIYDYVNSRNDYDGARTSTTDLPQRVSRVRVPNPKVGAAYKVMNTKKQEMIDSLGKSLYSDLEDDIEVLEDKSHAAVQGKGLGARGIHDLVRYEEMNKYLETERSHMKRWTSRLNRITDDRVGLFTKSEYHMSAWYFDADVPDQLMATLITEQNCVRDICRTDESLRALGEYFHGAPYFVLPGFASRLDTDFLFKKHGDLLKWFDDARNLEAGLSDVQVRVNEMGALLGNHWANSPDLNPNALAASHIVNAAYDPAIALRLQDWLAELQKQLDGPGLQAHLDKLSKFSNRGQRLGALYALKQGGIKLKVANKEDVDLFIKRVTQHAKLIEKHEPLIINRDKQKALSKKTSLSPAERNVANNEKIRLNNLLLPLENEIKALNHQIKESTIPTDKLAKGQIGLQTPLSPAQQKMFDDEVNRLKMGAGKSFGESGVGAAALKSSMLPMAALFMQVWNLKEALTTWRKVSGTPSLKERVIFIGAVTGAAASAISVYQNVHITIVDKAFHATKASTSGQGGTLFSVKLGKLGLGLGVLISPLALINSIGTAWDNWNKWADALRTGTTGEQAGALLALTGDIGSVGVNAAITVKMSKEIGSLGWQFFMSPPGLKVKALSTAWSANGLRFFSFAGRMTPWSLGLSALQLAGESIYNYFNLDDQQNWMISSCWGKENKNWDMDTHKQGLAESNLRPVITDLGLGEKNKGTTPVRTLLLTFPGLSLEELKEHPIRVQAELSAQLNRDAADVGIDVRDGLSLANINPLIARLVVPESWCGEQSQLKLRLSVQPDIANAPLKAKDEYLYYSISLSFLGAEKNSVVKGEPSVRASRTALQWVDVKPEHLHA